MKIEALQLLIILNIGHWLGDYTQLSTPWMLSAKRLGTPIFPIFCHALIHAFIAGIIVSIHMLLLNGLNPLGIDVDISDWSFILMLTSHFIIDVLKGRINGWFPVVSNPANPVHWMVFGFDQLLHQIILIIITFLTF